MKKQPLYRLPAFGSATFRAGARRALLAYVLTLGGLAWGLTQILAHRLAYNPALGDPWIPGPVVWGGLIQLFAGLAAVGALVMGATSRWRRLGVLLVGLAGGLASLAKGSIYTPIHLFVWGWRFREEPPVAALIEPSYRIFLAAAAGGLAFLALRLLLLAGRHHSLPDTHGSAHWASAEDVERAGLLAPSGLVLGLWRHGGRQRYLRHDGPEHVFVFAPTRTGKGVGLVLPNLLSWPHSVLVHDIKGENWALTAGWRRASLGSLCLRFDPTDTEGQSARYNPLEEVRLGAHEVRDAQTVADILVDPNGDRSRSHWDRTAHALLVGVILHVLYAEPDKTLRGCVHLLSNPERPVAETLEAMLTLDHDSSGMRGWRDPLSGEPTRTHPVVASTARALLDKSARELSSVISTALSFLDLYRDPVIAQNTVTSDFRLRDLMHHERPLSLYLTVPPSDLHRTRPLVRMLLNQALRRLTETMSFEGGRAVAHYRHRLLLMLDEFPALGRLAFFQESLAYLAGYGIRAFLITQDLAQHYGVYGREESITGNSHVRIAYTANKPETAELLSKMAGEMTVHLEQRSYRGGLIPERSTVSHQQTRRRLLTTDEALRLPEDDALIFVAGQPPIRATKVRYYVDRELSRRAAIPAPAVSDVVPGSG